MKWLRKLLGTDFPDPEVGQVWRSRHSGRRIKVSQVYVYDSGFVTVGVLYESERDPGCWNLVPQVYAEGLDEWRKLLREEARVQEVQWPRR